MMILIGRLLIGGVLLFAGFMKAVGPVAEFAASIEAYKLLDPAWIWPLAQGLPYVEMGLGMYLLTGFRLRRSALAAAGLFGVFIAAHLAALLRGIDIGSCGCFGAGQLSPKVTLVLDTILLSISLLIHRFNRTPGLYSLDKLGL